MKNKLYIRAAAFVTSLLILIVLMFCGFTVLGDSFQYNFSQFGISNIIRNSEPNEVPLFLNQNDTSFDVLWGIYSPNFSYSAHNGEDFSDMYSAASRYIIYGSSSVSAVPLPAESFIIYDDDYFMILSSNSNYYDFLGDHNSILTGEFSDNYSSYGYYALNYSKTVDGTNYSTTTSMGNNSYILSSNCPVYEVASVEDFDSMNDIIGDNKNPTVDPANVETSENNLYLEDAYYVWTTYSPTSDMVIGDVFNKTNIYKGFVTFSYQMTPFQEANKSEFTFKTTATITYSMKFTLHDEYKNWSGSYTYEIPFTQANGNSLKFNFSDIFNSSGFTGYFNNNSDGEIDFNNSVFNLVINTEVVSSRGSTSSDIQDTYSFLTDKVKSNSKAITNNNNPFVPSDSQASIGGDANLPTVQTGDGVVPTGNSITPSGSGTVNVIQNNNNGLINPKPVTDMVKNELLPNENDTNFVGLLSEQTHEDGFVSLMSTTFSFVPVTVWTSLSHYFNIFLTMLVAFFALRLILDIL